MNLLDYYTFLKTSAANMQKTGYVTTVYTLNCLYLKIGSVDNKKHEALKKRLKQEVPFLKRGKGRALYYFFPAVEAMVWVARVSAEPGMRKKK